jgi:hypothetical protein
VDCEGICHCDTTTSIIQCISSVPFLVYCTTKKSNPVFLKKNWFVEVKREILLLLTTASGHEAAAKQDAVSASLSIAGIFDPCVSE